METRTFRGYKTLYEVQGNPSDAYFKALPDHDLGGLANFLSRIIKTRHVRTCLDIGANIGLASLIMAELAPAARIMSFEPSPKTFDHLSANVGRNHGWAQISPQPFAVGSESKTIKFFFDDNMSHANHIVVDGSGTDVEMKSVDDFVFGAALDSVDFMKVDVEGFELQVFQGALKTILKHRPTIIFEFNEYAIVENAKLDPIDCLRGIIDHVGPLAVVNPANGEAIPLPAGAEAAISTLRGMMQSGDDIFDLVNQVA
jgi:FkbM family methyltransferase